MTDTVKGQLLAFLNDELNEMEEFRIRMQGLVVADEGILSAARSSMEAVRIGVIDAEPLPANSAEDMKRLEENFRFGAKEVSSDEYRAELTYRAERINQKLRDLGATCQDRIVVPDDAPPRTGQRWCFPD